MKKIITILGVTILFIFSIFFLYRIFSPKTNPEFVIEFDYYQDITRLSDFKKYENGKYPVWLTTNDENSQYIESNMLKQIYIELELNKIENIKKVNISSDISNTLLLKQWKLNGVPAFLLIEVADGEVNILNSLEWTTDNPFDVEDLKLWLKSANLIP